MSWIGRNFPVMLTVKLPMISLISSIPLIGTVFAPFGLKVYFPGETYNKGVWYRFRISSFGTSCYSIIEATHLWNITFSSSENCLLGSIFSFDGQFALITPVSIAMTIFLEILRPAIRLLVTTSFSFTRNSSCKRFGLPFLLCKLTCWCYHSFEVGCMILCRY